MSEREPEPNDPMWPYFRERVPAVPTGGRRWVAIVLLSALLSGFAFGVVGWLLRLL